MPRATSDLRFQMPKAVKITARTGAITNSFVNALIPVVHPTREQIDEALARLGMPGHPVCAYCGDTSSEWDHLRPLVMNRKPTGFISEIHNLVPSCGKCNQSKGNKPWRTWMYGPAKLSPRTRNIPDLDEREARLEEYENWLPPTRVDYAAIVGEEVWAAHWAAHEQIVQAMRDAQKSAESMNARVKAEYLTHGSAERPTDDTQPS